MRRVTTVQVLTGYQLSLTFDDGRSGTVDLSHLAGQGVFRPWQDRAAFEAVRIGPDGELRWGEQIDLCPDALYLQATGQEVGALYPAAAAEPTHA